MLKTPRSLSHLSVPGGGGPWGGDPLEESQGARHRHVGALRGVALVLRDEAGVLRGAYQVEVAQSGVQIQEHGLVLEPGRRRRQQQQLQLQLAAPSAALPSSLRI